MKVMASIVWSQIYRVIYQKTVLYWLYCTHGDHFHRINFIWNIPAPLLPRASSYTCWSDRVSSVLKLVLLCSCYALEPEIVFVDIQKYRQFPFGHYHEKMFLRWTLSLLGEEQNPYSFWVFSLWNVVKR